MNKIFSTDDLIDHLQQQHTLITVNNRLAVYYRRQFNKAMQSAGKAVWQSPDILPLQRWLNIQFEKLRTTQAKNWQLISSHEEKQIWIDIIQPDAYQVYMMPAEMIASEVMQAATIMQQWQIPLDELYHFNTPESQTLATWLDKFQQRCSRNHWLTTTGLMAEISAAIASDDLHIHQPVIMAGFQDPNKLHQHLFQHLNMKAGCSLLSTASINQTNSLMICRDLDEEIRQSALWAKQLLLSGETSIGIVIPELGAERDKVETVFTEILHPERHAELPPYSRQTLFEISLGQSLTDLPLINDALTVLELVKPKIALKTLNRILTATYLNNHTHNLPTQNAQIDAQLRDFGRSQWTRKALINYLQKSDNSTESKLAGQLQQIDELMSSQSAKQSLFEWTQVFIKIWDIMNWPGRRTLVSHEYQQQQRVLTLLEDFRKLHKVKSHCDAYEAIRLLQQLAGQAVFQPQSPHAAIQVMGLLEAADQQFDYLWLSGLDDRTLPANTAANAFIPLSLQRQYDVPHSSAARELQFAGKLLDSYQLNARHLMISHVEINQDMEMRASPLLQKFQLNAIKSIADEAITSDTTIELDSIIDDRISALPPSYPVRGGAGVLTQQALCPFKAIASFRLNARALQENIEGVSPIDRGNQIHRIMENIWQQLKTSANLKALGENDLKQLIDEHISAELTLAGYKRPDLYHPTLIDLEQQQIGKIIGNWLAFEKQRKHPFSVAEVEQQRQIEIGGIILTIKADRIDQLDNGERLILDYKTGHSANSKSWLEDSITEPQLPLYSMLETPQLSALALAKIHEKQCSFNGISKNADTLPGVKPLPENPLQSADQQWQALREQWQQKLTALAESYRQGNAVLQPDNCQYCDYPILCRKQDVTQEPSA